MVYAAPAPGYWCVALAPAPLSALCEPSEPVGSVAAGDQLRVLEQRCDEQGRVRARSAHGWVTLAGRDGRPLLERLPEGGSKAEALAHSELYRRWGLIRDDAPAPTPLPAAPTGTGGAGPPPPLPPPTFTASSSGYAELLANPRLRPEQRETLKKMAQKRQEREALALARHGEEDFSPHATTCLRAVQLGRKGAAAEVRRLLHAGADPNAADENGATALHHAAALGQEEVVAALVEGGASVNQRSERGASALMGAALCGRSRVVWQLLGLGADHAAVATGGVHEGQTALEMAEEAGWAETAGLLREAWAAAAPEDEQQRLLALLDDVELRMEDASRKAAELAAAMCWGDGRWQRRTGKWWADGEWQEPEPEPSTEPEPEPELETEQELETELEPGRAVVSPGRQTQ